MNFFPIGSLLYTSKHLHVTPLNPALLLIAIFSHSLTKISNASGKNLSSESAITNNSPLAISTALFIAICFPEFS